MRVRETDEILWGNGVILSDYGDLFCTINEDL